MHVEIERRSEIEEGTGEFGLVGWEQERCAGVGCVYVDPDVWVGCCEAGERG